MASIIGGIGTSHVPTIGVAYDKGKQQDPVWKPLFDGYTPVAAWLAAQQADVLVFFYNDHCTTFFFDLYPTFALGVGERFPVADEGAGLRNLPPIRGDVQLQAHIAECLVNDEFDLTVFQDKPIDHGAAAQCAEFCWADQRLAGTPRCGAGARAHHVSYVVGSRATRRVEPVGAASGHGTTHSAGAAGDLRALRAHGAGRSTCRRQRRAARLVAGRVMARRPNAWHDVTTAAQTRRSSGIEIALVTS